MKISRLMTCLILLLPALVRADGPATPGASTVSATPTAQGSGSFGQQFGFRGRGFITQQEWGEMLLFMQKYAPNRARVINENDAWDNPRVRAELLKHWRDYKFVAEHFPEVGDLRVKRFQVEDTIFGLELQVRRDPTMLESVRPQIRLQAAILVKLSIEEHKLRIQKLQNLLQQEQQRLSDEVGREDAQVDMRAQKIMDRIESELPKPPPPSTEP